jgi:hypothetical protein
MTHNEINDWMSFYSLDRLQLVDLRCRNNPILEAESMDCARQILIATISSVVGGILEFKLFIKGFFGQRPLVPLLLLGTPLFWIILFGSNTLWTRMTNISLHMQWPLTSQSHFIEGFRSHFQRQLGLRDLDSETGQRQCALEQNYILFFFLNSGNFSPKRLFFLPFFWQKCF